MCIFSRRVRYVSNTNIFARLSGRGTQYLVYSMKYSSDEPVAMILPLPVASPKKRIGIRFISFQAYSDFFNDVENGFPRPPMVAFNRGRIATAGAAMARPTIHVESVGDFIASYVPTLDDFDRVDPRFRLPRAVWNQIPVYADYGFAVFQLKDAGGQRVGAGSGAAQVATVGRPVDTIRRVHPMVFEFHTRFPDTLYYPTVHIHDGQLHPTERFDHTLYLQDPKMLAVGGSGMVALSGQRPLSTNRPASGFVECPKTQGVVDPSGPCYKFTLSGDLENKDTLIQVV